MRHLLAGLCLIILGLSLPLLIHTFDPGYPPAGYLAAWLLLGLGALLLTFWLLQAARGRRPSSPGTRRICGSILVLTVCFLALEFVAAALVMTTGRWEKFTEYRRQFLIEAQPIIIGHHLTGYIKNPLHPNVNAQGFFDEQWTHEKPDGLLRIACLGGSTTEDGYPAILQTELRERLPDRPVQVMNFGTVGWTSAHTLVNYCLNVRHYRPDIVVIHHGANEFKVGPYAGLRTDYANAFKPFSHPTPPPDAWLIRLSNAYALLRLRIRKAQGLPPAPTLEAQVLREDQDISATWDNLPEINRIFSQNLQALIALIQHDNSAAYIMTQPHDRTRADWSPAFHDHMDRVNESLRRLARDKQIALLDLADLWAGRQAIHIDPIHLTPEAIQAKAEALAEFIAARLQLQDASEAN